jgi:hypothetical protein
MEAFQWTGKEHPNAGSCSKVTSWMIQVQQDDMQKLLTTTVIQEVKAEEDQLHPLDHLSILLNHNLLP